MTLDLFDFTPEAPLPEAPYVRESATSKEAAEAIRPALAFLEEKVLEAVKAAGKGGLTCFEAEQVTKLPHQTCSARITGLSQKHLLRRTDLRRPTASGRMAAVYVASEAAA